MTSPTEAPADDPTPSTSEQDGGAADATLQTLQEAPESEPQHADTPPVPGALAQPGDIALLLTNKGRQRFIERLTEGGELHTHKGVVYHDQIIGHPWGGRIESHTGEPFRVLRPSMEEILVTTQRQTQIVFPKDIGYILLKLNIVPGTHVIEAGTGSGALTTALARYVGDDGQVYTYESRDEHQSLARKNIERLGLQDAVTFRHADIGDGFHDGPVQALFLDVREPWAFLDRVLEALQPGGFFGAIVPTINQVVDLTAELRRNPFADIEISELLLRQYRPNPERVRPLDRLTAHTGFLIFARRMAGSAGAARATGSEDRRTREDPPSPEELSDGEARDVVPDAGR